MKIAFFELEKWEEGYLKKRLKKHKLFLSNGELNSRSAKKIRDYEVVVVFIYSDVTKKILDKLPKLKLISTMSTGFDHIDLAECAKRRIRVCNVPTYGENTVAEHTVGLILNLSRKIYDSIHRTKNDNFSLKGLMGFDLRGKTLGVIGPGTIGQHVIRMAKAFEMKVIAYTPHTDRKLAKRLGFKYVSLNTLLKNSDVVTIHAPLNKGTYHLINRKNIKLFKKGALLINTSRGGIVDTRALLYGLDEGILAGAGLDVLEDECFIKEERQLLKNKFAKTCDWQNVVREHLLIKKKNVIMTPHSAFYSKEALMRILDTTVDNIQAFKKKKRRNVVKYV